MFTRRPANKPAVILLGGALSATAGCVDAIGFISLSGIYVANMSGNTVGVAIHLARRDWAESAAHLCPIVAFLPGLVIGDALVELCRRLGVRQPLAPALLLEALGLIAFYPMAHAGPASVSPWRFSAMSILAFSMGVQNGALRRVGALEDVHTYVTGTLLAIAHGFARYLFWLGHRLKFVRRRRWRGIVRYSFHHRSLRKSAEAAMLWIVYLSGAVTGAMALARLGIGFVAAPITVLLTAALITYFQPAAVPSHQGHAARP